jgi:predicted metalloenzyme YecM
MSNYGQFLNTLFEEAEKLNLDLSNLELDHIAYQVTSSEDYDEIKNNFLKLGNLINEKIIGNRRVAVFKLNNPISHQKYSIWALELVEPKKQQKCESQLQHAEFIYTEDFEKLINKYPNIHWDTSSIDNNEFSHLKLNLKNGLTIKFVHTPILKSFKNK